MNGLAKWFKERGPAGRKALYLAIKARRPRFSQSSLSQYSLGQRTADYEVAQLISEFTGLPLAAIPHHYSHRPEACTTDKANGDKSQSEKTLD